MVNKITWRKAGGVTEPGRYMFTFGWLTVTAEDLAVWNRFPDAAFTLVSLPQAGSSDADIAADIAKDFQEEFHLGTFELPAGCTPCE